MVNNLIVCGGTFDHFHKGHESLLKLAFSLGNKVVIGVTNDSFVKSEKRKAKSEKQIELFEKRKQAVLEFIKTQGVLNRTKIVEIGDLFGPTLSRNLVIDAIVISKETRKGAEIINEERKKLGLKDLKIIVVPSVYAEDGKLISSARIRGGEISKVGKIYVNPSWLKTDLILPEGLREEFQKPFGELFKDISDSFNNKSSLVITVGDITTKNFNNNSLGQNISVIDFKVAREKKFESIRELGFVGSENIFHVDNPAGHITFVLFKTLSEILKAGIKSKIILQVNGEEDLTVLPLVLLAPLNTIIYYGQPSKGVVRVVVSEESKDKAYSLISKLKLV